MRLVPPNLIAAQWSGHHLISFSQWTWVIQKEFVLTDISFT